MFKIYQKNDSQIEKDREYVKRIYDGDVSVEDELYNDLREKCMKSLKHYCSSRDIAIDINEDIKDVFSEIYSIFCFQVKEGKLTPNNLTRMISSHLYQLGVWHIKTRVEMEKRHRNKSMDVAESFGYSAVMSSSGPKSNFLTGDDIDWEDAKEDAKQRGTSNTLHAYNTHKRIGNPITLPIDLMSQQEVYEVFEWKDTVRKTINDMPEPCSTILHDQFLYKVELGEYEKDNDTLADENNISHIKMVKHRCMEKAKRIFLRMPGFMATIKDLNILSVNLKLDIWFGP